MAKSVILPSKEFKTKAEATKFFKDMLNRYRDGETLNQDDSKFLYELVLRHPEIKIGVGVSRFYRDMTPDYPTSCFHLERPDGSKTDFSYKTCIDGYSTPLEQQFHQACRQSVSEELTRQKNTLFKESGGTMLCSKTGVIITVDTAEYRHTEPKAIEIIRDFIATFKINITQDLIAPSKDMTYKSQLTDLEMERDFQKFHASKAHLAMFRKFEH